jgi:hypothetical protein
MIRYLTSAFVFCTLPLLAACATSTLEAQTKTHDPRQARIYFMREASLLYVAGAPTVRVNGQQVGSVGSGSYFFVDRPPGQYNVTLDTPLVPGRFAANVNVRAAGVYYLKVAPRTEHWALGFVAGPVAQILEAQIQENSGAYSITAVDQKTGAAMLAQMK